MTFRVLDLFAGAGGLTAGFHTASPDFHSVAAVEMDPEAAASYQTTFPETDVYAGPIQEWLAEGMVPDGVDVVIGGPPCQGFSTLGKRDERDARNWLWEQYAQAILRARPRYFVMENVPAFSKSPQYRDLLSATGPGEVLDGYSLDLRVLNAADYGAPQARRRAVLIGHREDVDAPGFPDPTHSPGGAGGLIPYRTVRQALAGVPAQPDMDDVFASRRVRVGSRQVPGAFVPRELHVSRRYGEMSLSRFAEIPPGGDRRDLPDHLKAPCWRRHDSGARDVMGRLHWDRPSVTIRTGFTKPEKGRYLHPSEDRAITHYEAALLQGFPDTHRFIGSRTSIARQIGNAVPVQLGAAVARQLLEHL